MCALLKPVMKVNDGDRLRCQATFLFFCDKGTVKLKLLNRVRREKKERNRGLLKAE